MYVNAGELNKRIEICRKPEPGPGGYLPEGAEPEPVRRCWAKFTQTSGTEMVKANADFGEVRVRFLIRYTRGVIDRKMFVRYRNVDYEILYINGYGDSGEYLELWCRALGNGRQRAAGPTEEEPDDG